MNSYIDSEIILQRRVSPFIYVYTMIIFIIMLSLIILSMLFEYSTYLDVKGIVVEDNDHFYIDIYVEREKVSKVVERNILYIDDIKYEYKVILVSDEIVNNYQVVRIDTNLKDENKYNNLILSIKILDSKKKIINFIGGKHERN